MVLERLDGQRLVAEPHDFAVLAFGRDFQDVGERGALHGEGMVAHGREALVEPGEEPLAVVADAARLAVHEPFRRDDASAEGLGDGLVAEADAENRQASGEGADSVERDAGGVRVARAGREDESLRFQGFDSGDIDFIVPDDLHLRAKGANHLHEVVGEGVVVVDHEYHCSSSAKRTASKTAFALPMVSSYSRSGTESATIPAPDRIVTRAPSLTSVRMTMAKSMSPVSEK